MSKWKFRQSPDGDAPVQWARDLAITPFFLQLLWRRGLTDKNAIDAYLAARLNTLTPPSRWPQVPQAARLLASELLAGKKIAVWGDYDVDGITATTIVLDVLEAHGIAALHHLPDRLKEGYGLNIEHIESMAYAGCQILLTVDCGITDAQAIARARELGLTVVVSDHHLPPQELPPASGIVNPRIDSAGPWPCQHLAGVGVAFYLMAAVNELLAPHTGKRYKMDKALDLVALGTLADIMPLEGENRILVRGGLGHIAKPVRPGMTALKVVSGFDVAAELTSGQTVFRLAPRINAAGRMGHPDMALELLRAKDFSSALALASRLNDFNTCRKQEEERIVNEARDQASRLLAQKNYAALALYGPGWHPGIIGIVASRIVEEFQRPTFVLCRDNISLKGSGRSVPDFDLYAALEKTAHTLLGFGGHKQAAGLRLQEDRLEEFRSAFAKVAHAVLGDTPSPQILLLDSELDFSKAGNHEFLREIQLMQPFGPGNPEPVFASPRLTIKKRSFLGHSHDHVLLQVEDEKTGITLPAKAWRRANEFPPSMVGKKIYIAYTPKIDLYNGIPSIDLGLKDWCNA